MPSEFDKIQRKKHVESNLRSLETYSRIFILETPPNTFIYIARKGEPFLERRGRELTGGLWEFNERGQVVRESKRSGAE